MRTMRTLFICTLLCVSLHAVAESKSNGKTTFPLESIFNGPDFQSRALDNLQWSEDGSSFTYTRRDPSTGLLDIYEQDVTDSSERLLLGSKRLTHQGKNVEMSAYQWSGDRRYLLISGPKVRTWDSVIEGPYYIYDSASQSIIALADGNETLRNVRLSPGGEHVGYVLDNNLYVTDLSHGTTVAVTEDGDENIFNAIFDYTGTGFGFVDAWHWSPDGRKIAFWRIDVTDVKVFWIVDELGKYNELYPLKYPNTAEKHAVNQIGVYKLDSGQTTWMDIGENTDDYIPRINWTRSSTTLSIQRISRTHKLLELMLADVETGKSTVIVTDTDPAWIDVTRDLTFFADEDKFVWTSEKSGYRHAYLYDYEGNEKQLTQGDWEIHSLIALDEANGWLYFYAKKDSFIDQHVYRVGLDGSAVERLSGESGWYT